jgi:predicted outer membrane protein
MRTYLLCIALLASCGDDDNNNNGGNNGSDEEQAAIDMGDQRGNALASQIPSEFGGISDAAEVAKAAAIVTTLNTGEIAQANLVLGAGGAPAVRELASEIVADHEANEQRLHALLATQGIAPADNPISLTIRAEGMMGLQQLQNNPSPSLDFEYARMQVMMHEEGFMIVGAVRDHVRNEDVRSFLSHTQDAIKKHREHAGDVLNGL